MKQIKEYIAERLKISSDLKHDYKYFPKTKDELINTLKELIKERGGDADLNDIDTSKIDNMSYVFTRFAKTIRNIDISQWDVSNVKHMQCMFLGCEDFNCDLSGWNVKNLRHTGSMFCYCKKFDSDLSQWNTENLVSADWMFAYCKNFNSDLSNWKTHNIMDISYMFYGCEKFNYDLSRWDISKLESYSYAFKDCESLKKLPSWYEIH